MSFFILLLELFFVILDYEITADSAVYLFIYTELYSNCDRLRR